MRSLEHKFFSKKTIAVFVVVGIVMCVIFIFPGPAKSFAKKGWQYVVGSGAEDIIEQNSDFASGTFDDPASSSLFSADFDATGSAETTTETNFPSDDAKDPPKKKIASGNGASQIANSVSKIERASNASSSVSFTNDDTNDSADNSLIDIPKTPCPFPSGTSVAAPSRKIIFNEIAWMGSPPASGEKATDAAKNEWVEIKNNGATDADLSGWRIANASGKLKITFTDHDHLPANGVRVLAHDEGAATYSGDLVNGGDLIAIIDPACAVSDILDASHGWPGGVNTTKQTLERDADGIGWHTSALPGGTPGRENSALVASVSSSPPASPQPSAFTMTVDIAGNGRGTVVSTPPGIDCVTAHCSWNFSPGEMVIVTASPDTASIFAGWSGVCSGDAASCAVSMASARSITATFTAKEVVQAGSSSASSTPDPTPDPVSEPVASSSASGTIEALGHLVIAGVSIAGASTTNDLVKIYNPTANAVDVSGWKLKKRTNTGSEASIRTFPDGNVVGAGAYFVWANSSGGFSLSIGADVSSTATLAADNSIALINASDTVIDALAWGTGADQWYEGTPFPSNPAAGQMLARTIAGGTIVDTDNNASDFALVQ